MRAFLSKFLLTIFIAIFSVPSSLLASPGNNWTPPVGGPTVGTNVPAPVNIGPQGQTKEGALRLNGTLTAGRDFKVDFGSILSGGTFFDNDTDAGGGDFMASFVPATFLNQFNVGSQGNAGPEINLFGRLRYKPTNADGSDVQGGQPSAGDVLKATDNQGNITWGPALPGGVNNGDTLIWNVECNCWTTGPGGGGGTGSLPPGTPGQTLWFDNTTNSWQATNKLEYFGPQMDSSRINTLSTTIFSKIVGIGKRLNPGEGSSVTTIESNSFSVRGWNNITLGTGGIVDGIYQPSQNTNLNSENVTFRWNLENQQDVDFQSNTVEFGVAGDDYYPQDVTFNSSSVKFKGPPQHPEYLDAGVGRIPMSVDADGTFKWNKYLTYGNIPFAPGLNLGQLNLANPENGIAVFANAGVSYLADATVIGPNGHLYLEGLEGGNINQAAAGEIKHLCYIETNKKVVKCPTATDPNATLEGIQPPRTGHGNGTVMYTVEDNGYEHPFNFTGTVSVKYCGGGGGGGGGGRGAAAQDGGAGTGGSGGGGGEAGKCNTEDIDVTPGSVLRWNIGQGGQGGSPAIFSAGATSENSLATSGFTGQPTTIIFDPVSGPENQIGPASLGGFGGGAGGSVSQGNLIGIHGNINLASGSDGWYWNGGLGSNTNPQPPQNINCPTCGGVGGVGEAYTSNGTLRGPGANAITSAGYSYRGDGGTGGGTDSMNMRFGRSGYCGAPGHGGGGGGGGYGQGVQTFIPYSLQFKGGQGGCGGGGYVLISGLPTSTPSSGEIVYSTPGTFSLSTFQENNTIPSDVDTFTIEVWGAGGGAGGIKTSNTEVRRAGGGGAGGYRTMTLSRNNLFNAEFVVGAKGANGTNTSSSGTPTDGVTGGLSQVRNQVGTPGFQALGADGGEGGTAWINTGNAGQGGAGGDQFPNGYPAGVTVGTNGVDGASNSGPCNLAQETITPNNGFGAGSPRTCTDGTLNIYQGSAQNGRIRISW